MTHPEYTFIRERGEDTLPWARPSELRGVTLPRPVILLNGAFDVFHSGHAKLCFAARRRARRGTVIIAMDSDLRVNRKGIGRPVQSYAERSAMLRYMPVDYLVEIDSDADMRELVAACRPDYRMQGSDYLGRRSAFPGVPKLFVRGTGMRTSTIIERAKLCGE